MHDLKAESLANWKRIQPLCLFNRRAAKTVSHEGGSAMVRTLTTLFINFAKTLKHQRADSVPVLPLELNLSSQFQSILNIGGT
jgi:hypothetical protein